MRQARRIPHQRADELSLAEIDEALGNLDGARHLDYLKFQELFTGHNSWGENTAVGAAGELFVSLMRLRRILLIMLNRFMSDCGL
jgi:hypothetical protein